MTAPLLSPGKAVTQFKPSPEGLPPSIRACLRMVIRVPLFGSRCRGPEKTRHSFCTNNMGRGLPLRSQPPPLTEGACKRLSEIKR